MIFLKSMASLDTALDRAHQSCVNLLPELDLLAALDVQFYDSAIPLRRHEEVIVFTSIKPFEKYNLYQEKVCPYCMERFDLSKNHSKEQHNFEDYTADKQRRHSDENAKLKKYTVNGRTEKRLSAEEVSIQMFSKTEVPKQAPKHEALKHEALIHEAPKHEAPKYEFPKHELSEESHEFDYDQIKTEPKSSLSDENKDTEKSKEKIIDKGHSKSKKTQETKKHPQKHSLESVSRHVYSDEQVNSPRKHTVTKMTHRSGYHGLKEICIHAFVHEPSAGGCNCGNCVELWTEKDDGKKLERYLATAALEEQKVKSEEHVPRHSVHRTEKEAAREIKDVKDRKGKAKEAHILARILKAEDVKSMSDTDLSTVNSSDIRLLTKRTKIISEEDYNRKKEKLKKKNHKRQEEVYKSTKTTDSPDPKRETKAETTKIERESLLTVIDEKCSTLMKLTWTTIFLVLFLIFIVFVCLMYCCSGPSRSSELESSLPCFFDYYLQYFQ